MEDKKIRVHLRLDMEGICCGVMDDAYQGAGGRMSKHIFLGNDRIVTKQIALGTGEDYDNADTGVERKYTYYYHADHLGSTSVVTDRDGEVYERLEYTPYGETWLDETSGDTYFDTPYRFSAKEKDEETGLYYYGARYLDPKYSRWISADPALGEYLPQAPVNDEARKHNQSLPGGGLFETGNLALYNYSRNNPICYNDPDGKIANLVIGAFIGFAASTASEVVPRMISGQSFGDAVYNTFTDPTALTNIGVSTVLGAATSGASSLAAKGVTSTAKIAATNIAINTAGGAIDAASKDVIGKAVTGEKQNLVETGKKALIGAGSALLFSGVTEGVIAADTTKSAVIDNVMLGTLKDVKITPPGWAGSAGVVGETVLPTTVDTIKQIVGNNNE